MSLVPPQAVPVERFRPLVEHWLAGHESNEEAFRELDAASPYGVAAWRFRLSDGYKRSKKGTGRGWFTFAELDAEDVEEFLVAAGLNHLWHTELHDLLVEAPDEKPTAISDEEFDATCAKCGTSIDWSEGSLAGVRVEVKRPRKWTQWWSLCVPCYAREMPVPARKPDCTGQIPTPKFPDEQQLALYLAYVNGEVGLEQHLASIWAQYGFASLRCCSTAISAEWRRRGWPVRNRNESKRANNARKLRGGEPRDHIGRLTIDELQKLHLLHRRKRLSIHRMCVQLHERYGYKSAKSMVGAVSQGWKQLGLEAWDRIEMTVEASTTNGLSPRDWQTRKRLRLEAGLTQKGKEHQSRCTGTTQRGKRCPRPAIYGLEHCPAHDPSRASYREEHLAAMRLRSPKQNPANLTTVAAVRPALAAWLAPFPSTNAGCKALCELTGIAPATLSRYARSAPKQQRMTKQQAQRILDGIARVELEVAA